jgi:hypothetical protein
MKIKLQRAFPVTLPLAVILLGAFSNAPQQNQFTNLSFQDTIPEKRNKVTREEFKRDLDKELYQLDKTEKEFEKLKDKDWLHLQQQLEESLRKIDLQKTELRKMEQQVQASLRKIDFDKLDQQINLSLEGIDKFDKEDVKKHMYLSKLHMEKAMKNAAKHKELYSLKHFDHDRLHKQLQGKMKLHGLDMKKSMADAQKNVHKQRKVMEQYQHLIYEMEKDGLLNTKEDYSIAFKNNELHINGKQQPQSVVEKYRKYIDEDMLLIKKEAGKLQIINHKKTDSHMD